MIGVAAHDEPLGDGMFDRCKTHMTDIFNTLNNTKGIAFEWTIETVPDGAFLAFARAVAGSVASGYSAPQYSGLYEVGIDGLKEFAAPDLTHENHVTTAEYF